MYRHEYNWLNGCEWVPYSIPCPEPVTAMTAMAAKCFRIMGKSSDGIAAPLSRDTRSGRPILGWMYENGRGVQRGPRGSCPLVSTCGGSGRFVGAGAARPVFDEQSNGV